MLRPQRVLTISVPRSLCGAAQFAALSGSFGHLCVSRNARVPLRYASQPFRRKPAPSRSLKAAWFCLSNRFFDSCVTAKRRRNFYVGLSTCTRRGLFLGLVRRRVGKEQFDCRLVLASMGSHNRGLVRRQRYAAAFTQGLHPAGSSRPQRVLTILVPHHLWGAEQKMSRETALLARLDKQSPNDRALRGLPLTGPRTVSERLSRGKGYFRGKPKIASMKNAHSLLANARALIRSVIFGCPLKAEQLQSSKFSCINSYTVDAFSGQILYSHLAVLRS